MVRLLGRGLVRGVYTKKGGELSRPLHAGQWRAISSSPPSSFRPSLLSWPFESPLSGAWIRARPAAPLQRTLPPGTSGRVVGVLATVKLPQGGRAAEKKEGVPICEHPQVVRRITASSRPSSCRPWQPFSPF